MESENLLPRYFAFANEMLFIYWILAPVQSSHAGLSARLRDTRRPFIIRLEFFFLCVFSTIVLNCSLYHE